MHIIKPGKDSTPKKFSKILRCIEWVVVAAISAIITKYEQPPTPAIDNAGSIAVAGSVIGAVS
jgi:hypothetical protein